MSDYLGYSNPRDTGEIFVAAYVYILASKKNGVKRLVWYREHDSIIEAITDKNRIKRWRREWKIKLIEEMNPDWNELYRGWGL
jgi:hypothetical protein